MAYDQYQGKQNPGGGQGGQQRPGQKQDQHHPGGGHGGEGNKTGHDDQGKQW